MQVISCIFRALFSNIVKFKDWQVRIFQQNFMKWGEGGVWCVGGGGVEFTTAVPTNYTTEYK